jgi:hypothetical protein
MIITKEVIVVLGGLNVSYYKKLGYNIPKVKGKWGYTIPHGTEITVKVLDLPKTSDVLIQCYCDKCLKIDKKELVECTYNYYNIKKSNNKDILCKTCKDELKSIMIKNSNYQINRHNKSALKKERHKEKQRIKKKKERLDYLTEVRKIALEIGLIPDFKNEEYINSKQKLKFLCPIHGDIPPKTANQITSKYGCKFCSAKKVHDEQRYNYKYVRDKYLENGFILLEDTYINTEKPNKCYCIKHPNIIQFKCFKMILDNRICFYCQHEIQQKEGHPSWKGGITVLYNYLRTVIEPWKYNSSNFYNNKCVLTGKYETVVHHLHKSFKSIVEESLEYYNIDLKYIPISDLSKDLLYLVEVMVMKLHYKYGFGIPLHKEIHRLFHKLYGTKNNTPEQFEEFKTRLRLGEFNYFLEENKLKLTFV